MAQLLLATEGGQIVEFDASLKTHRLVFQCSDDEAMMGIEIYNHHVFVASLSRIYKLRLDDYSLVKKTEWYQPSPDFHQHQFHDRHLYATVTKLNQIWMFDEDLHLVKIHDIEPPIPDKKPQYKENYNHINNIVHFQGKFYINLNWLTSTQYASSGVAVYDTDFNLLEKFPYGWETHDFQFIDGKRIAICATSSTEKPIHHPLRSGIMIDGTMVFEHDSHESFCKGLSYDDHFLYLCGGRKHVRAERKFSNAMIYILNRADYSLVERFESSEIKAIKGLVILN